MYLVDFDTVDVENLAVQGFVEADLGMKKVKAVARACSQINSGIRVNVTPSKFCKEMISGIEKTAEDRIVVISGVDKMEVRKQIWGTYAAKFADDDNALFVDARMGAEVARILAVRGTEEKDYYEKTLFLQNDGLQQSCTAKSTIYCANIAAGMVVGVFTKWLRGMRPDRDTLYNIFATEVTHDAENYSS